MHGVIASLKDFDKSFPKSPKTGPRREALIKYFAMNGVVKANDAGKEWPKLSYPNIDVLNSKIRESKERKKIYESKLSEWKKKHHSAANYHQSNQLKKFAEPLYWKHLAKTISDEDYRKDASTVKLPVHLVSDKKWQPMVKMFVNDAEYRKQLAETVSTSIVYKKSKKVAKFADDLQDFRKTAAGKQVIELEEKISDAKSLESALKEMQKWARE